MKIGNVYNYDLDLPLHFNKVETINENELTLIVGWKKAKELYPEMSILDWRINEFVYWTVEPIEDKIVFEGNFAKFNNVAIQTLISHFTYEYIDLLLNPAPVLDFNAKTVILLRNNIFYIKNFKNIYGISLELSTHLNLNLKNTLLDLKIEIDDELQNKFGIDDRYLICFL
jgi:hypothetical protein